MRAEAARYPERPRARHYRRPAPDRRDQPGRRRAGTGLLSPAARTDPDVRYGHSGSKGKLIRACATPAADGMVLSTNAAAGVAAQRQAFDRLLENHELYCTICDMPSSKRLERFAGKCTHDPAVMSRALELWHGRLLPRPAP